MEFNFSEWLRNQRTRFLYWFVDYVTDFLVFFMKLTSMIMLCIFACQMTYVYFKW